MISFRRIVKALIHSYHGILATWKSEPAFRQDALIVAIGLIVASGLDISPTERALLIFSTLWILAAELINTAIETIINRISHDIHPLSKKAKDIGSAVVFMAFFQAVCVWGIIVWPIIAASI